MHRIAPLALEASAPARRGPWRHNGESGGTSFRIATGEAGAEGLTATKIVETTRKRKLHDWGEAKTPQNRKIRQITKPKAPSGFSRDSRPRKRSALANGRRRRAAHEAAARDPRAQPHGGRCGATATHTAGLMEGEDWAEAGVD